MKKKNPNTWTMPDLRLCFYFEMLLKERVDILNLHYRQIHCISTYCTKLTNYYKVWSLPMNQIWTLVINSFKGFLYFIMMVKKTTQIEMNCDSVQLYSHYTLARPCVFGSSSVLYEYSQCWYTAIWCDLHQPVYLCTSIKTREWLVK